jgi:uncharacterized protein YbjT (DUF2867 family)/predicted DCC family thiol-disulfide oxidoreductase YuxK
MADPRWPVRVFYDASCRLCAAEMHNLRLRDRHGRIRFVDCSAPGFAGGPAPTAQLMDAMHCQDAAGRVFVGVDAFEVLYHAVGLDRVQAALANPLIGGLSRRLYPWVARHRQRLPAWLIAPVFERAARQAAEAAAQRSQACAQGGCEMPAHAAPVLAGMAAAQAHADPASAGPGAPSPAQPAASGDASPSPGGQTFLLTGASGFIGRRIAAELRARGHRVLAASRRSTPPCDFVHMTRAADWQPWLADPATGRPIAGVINAVGALRDRAGRSLQALHADAPMALFDACAEAGVRRVVQVSALGIADGDTAYARTKRQADAHLLALNEAGRLDGLVLRPSVVFGRGGESSALFMALARLPVLTLPRAAREQPIQPVAVAELAEAVVNLALTDATGMQALGGPRALTMAEFIASLRAQLGHRPALQITQPDWFTRTTARLGDAVPVSPWCSASWALMRTPNACAPGALPSAHIA